VNTEHVDRPAIDACLGTTVDSATDAYHYYSLSPCILQSAAQERNYTCDKDKTCAKNIAEYLAAGYTSAF